MYKKTHQQNLPELYSVMFPFARHYSGISYCLCVSAEFCIEIDTF